jgi:uncharacterized membrane protein YgcG
VVVASTACLELWSEWVNTHREVEDFHTPGGRSRKRLDWLLTDPESVAVLPAVAILALAVLRTPAGSTAAAGTSRVRVLLTPSGSSSSSSSSSNVGSSSGGGSSSSSGSGSGSSGSSSSRAAGAGNALRNAVTGRDQDRLGTNW